MVSAGDSLPPSDGNNSAFSAPAFRAAITEARTAAAAAAVLGCTQRLRCRASALSPRPAERCPLPTPYCARRPFPPRASGGCRGRRASVRFSAHNSCTAQPTQAR